MSLSTRLFPGDEELAKRDDDHQPRMKPQLGAIWHHQRWPLRRNVKRIGLILLGIIAVYYFIKNMPTNLEQHPERLSHEFPPLRGSGMSRQRPPPPESAQIESPAKIDADKTVTNKPIGNKPAAEKPAAEKHWYNGPIKFYELAATLYAIGRARGGIDVNHNVLFAASSLKSAATLLPIACEMARWARNDVHFAFMGRDKIPIKTLMEINGATAACNVNMHDARPDYATESTDFRMEVSSGAALKHINNFMHPQAVIVDNSDAEEKYFLKGLKDRSLQLGRTVIELPDNAYESLRWLTRLDSSSLNAYNKVSIDILIHAQPSASGSLIRLLTSLKNADYFSSPPPRLTIELPHEIDEAATHFLANSFTWPPSIFPVEGSAQKITLRRRIPHGLTPQESSIRFLESFWPANRFTSHVLVLSPQVELSPLYYHFLKYALLEYKYSAAAATSLLSHEDLLGISLDLPSTYLNDTTSFVAPTNPESAQTAESNGPSFLWGSPNSNAALYFGDKWTELHTLASHSQRSKSLPLIKRISTTFPSWLELILTLSNSRGYSMLYPQLTAGDALATVHNELYQLPEEFKKPKEETEEEPTESDTLTADPAKHLSLQHKEMPLARASLLNLLPDDQLLAPLSSMPLITWDGRQVERKELRNEAEQFSARFRLDVGGCKRPVSAKTKLLDVGVENLFCDGGEQEEEDPDDEDKASTATKESESTAQQAIPARKQMTDEEQLDDEDMESITTERQRNALRRASTQITEEGTMDEITDEGISVGT